MNRFLCLQTFQALLDDEAALVASYKWGRVRVEGTRWEDGMAQCQKYDQWPLWILERGQELDCPSGIDVEIGNECNGGCSRGEGVPPWPKLTPEEYARWVMAAWPVLFAKGCTVYVGAANNTSQSALAWTKDVLSRLPFHPQLRVSFHRYPGGDQNPMTPQKGHHSIAAENAAILDVVRGRRWAISEAGLTDATYRTWSWDKYFGKKRTRRAADGHLAQARRFKTLGAEFYTPYQIRGNPYGILGTATMSLPLVAL